MTRRALSVCSAAVLVTIVGLVMASGARRDRTPSPDAPKKVDASLAAAIAAARYRVGPVTGSTDLQAPNPEQGYHARFTPTAIQLTSADGAKTSSGQPAWRVGLELTRFGYGDSAAAVMPGVVSGEGNRVQIARAAITEWYVNRASGLEQGFTIPAKPSGATPGAPLRLELVVAGDLRARVNPQATSVALASDDGGHVLTYDHLVSTDARGRALPSHFEGSGSAVTIVVDDANAKYPVTIDPTFTQQAWLKASNTGVGDAFGLAVAISGNTAVVGAPNEDSAGSQGNDSMIDSGAAYVFVRTAGVWAQQAYLKAALPQTSVAFGTSVAISGDTIAVGATHDGTVGPANSGSVFIFVRSGTTWSQQAMVKASNAESADSFGTSVGLSGDSLVVGAPNEDSAAVGVNGNSADNTASASGAAYVFTRTGTSWAQQAYLKASNTEAADLFGISVAIDGDTVVIGSSAEDGAAVGVDGNGADNSKSAAGAAYVFARSGTVWSQQAYLKASNTDAGDQFGVAVAVSGSTVIVGANAEASNATGVNGDQSNNTMVGAGAVYVFVRSGVTWAQQAYLKASNTNAGDQFGRAVAIDGDAIVIGASTEDSSAVGVDGDQLDNATPSSGAAYAFSRSGTVWTQQNYLKGPAVGSDGYGSSVGVSGTTVILGAPTEASSATGVNGNTLDNSAPGSGAAVVFAFNRPPVAVAGTDQTIEATSASGASVTLNGSGASDPDGDTLTYTWRDASSTIVGSTATVNLTLPIGSATYTLTVSDGTVSATDSVTIVVQDTVGPAITVTAPTAGATYAFNQVVNASYTCIDAGSTTATCVGTVPTGAAINTATAGTKTFSVTATDSLGNTSNTSFNYTVSQPAPTVAVLVQPSCTGSGTTTLTNCPVAGGATLTIVGTNFSPTGAGTVGVNGVCLGGVATVVSNGTVFCNTSVGGNSTDLRVTAAGGQSSGSPQISYQLAALPTVSSLTLNSCNGSGTTALTGCPAAGGSTLTIVGTNFYPVGGTVAVSPSSVCGASANVVDSTHATCTTVASGNATSMRVTANGGQSSGSPVISYATAPLPTLASLTLAGCTGSGSTSLTNCPSAAGATLTLTGTNFFPTGGTIALAPTTICGSTATITGTTTATCTMLANGAGTNLKVTSNGGQSSGSPFISLSPAAPPTVTSMILPTCAGSGTNSLTDCAVAGGQTLTFVGTNFYAVGGTMPLTPGSVCGSSATIATNTTATCTTLTTSAGFNATSMKLTANGGQTTGSPVLSYTTASVPTVTSLTMAACAGSGTATLTGCPVAGGNALTIVGTNFSPLGGTVAVSPSNVCGASATVVDSTHATCTTLSAGNATSIKVTANGGQSSGSPVVSFNIAGLPTITSLTLAGCTGSGTANLTNCPVAAGATLTITGTNFYSTTGGGGGTMALLPATICGSSATITSPTTAICTMVAGGSGANFRVTANGGQSSGSPFISLSPAAAPSVTSLISPSCAGSGTSTLTDCNVAGGTVVTIVGTNFYSATGTIGVSPTSMCGSSASIVSNSTATCTAIAGAAGGNASGIVVTANGGQSSGSPFTSYTFAKAPTVTSLALAGCFGNGTATLTNCPATAGATLTLTGTNFLPAGGTMSVTPATICGSTATIVSNTTATCVMVANGAGSGVQVTAAGGQSSGSPVVSLASAAPPTVTALILPSCAGSGTSTLTDCPVAGGALVTIVGTNFVSANGSMALTPGTMCGTSANITSSTTATCTTVFSAPGTSTTGIAVTANGGQSSGSPVVSYTTASLPTVTSLSMPACTGSGTASLTGCPVAGGNTLTIVGTNFSPLGGTVAVSPSTVCGSTATVVDGTHATCTTLPSGNGTSIKVTANGGQSSGSPVVSYAVAGLPTVQSLTLAGCTGSGTSTLTNCPTAAGSTVTITGTNFFGATLALTPTTICGSTATVVNTTTATCTTVASPAGSLLRVTANGGQSSGSPFISLASAAAPTVTALISPACSGSGTSTLTNCPVAGGTVVTIMGTNFYSGTGTMAVTPTSMCGATANIVNNSTATCTTVAGAAGGNTSNIRVTANGGLSTGPAISYTRAAAPTVTSVQHPNCSTSGNSLTGCAVAGGGTLTIFGTNFGPLASSPVIANNGICSDAPVHVVGFESTRLTCTLAPATAGASRIVSVDAIGGTSAGTGVTIGYLAAPIVTSVSHALCSTSGGSLDGCPVGGGGTLTITGSGFGSLAGNPVTVGDNLCATSPVHVVGSENTQVTCTLAPGAAGSNHPVTVTSVSGTSNASAIALAYAPVPTLTSVQHTQCVGSGTTALSGCPPAGGGTLTITGTGFVGPVSTIAVSGGVCNAAVTVNSSTSLTCTLAAGTGLRSTKVTTNGGITAVQATLSYNAAPTASNRSYLTTDHVAVTGNLVTDAPATIDPDGDELTATLVAQAAHGVATIAAGGAFTYQPNGSFAGTDTFTYRLNDGTADSNVATVTITIADATAPAIAGHGVVTAEVTGPAGAVVNYVSPTALDAIDGAVGVSCLPASGSLFPLGSTTVTCTATDAAHNTSLSTFEVKVVDTTGPAVTVPANITAAATSAAGATVTFTSSASDIHDGAVSTTCAPVSGSTFPIGATTVTCSATDAAGNTSSATFTVTVNDQGAPVVTVPANITAEATAASGASVTFSTSATDTVDGAVASICAPASGSVFAIGSTTVTCAATDAHGNSGGATFTVTVQDTTPPTVTVPANIATSATSAAGATVTFTASATDIVDGSVNTVCVPASGSVFAIGSTTVMCTATDVHGNTGSAAFTVDINDHTPPTVTVPANITAESTSSNGATVMFTASATDIVDGSVSTVCSPASGSVFAIGSTTVTCTATDAHGNSGGATFTVTVQDTTPPTVTVPANITAEPTSANGAAVTFTASATDIVDGSVNTVCSPAPGSVFAVGSTTVTCTATDGHGNAGSAAFTVDISDHTPPTVTVPANMTAESTSANGATVTFTASATDIVDGSVSTVCSPASGSIFAIGSTTVTCTATDAHGNASSAAFTVSVSDHTPPTVTVPANIAANATSSAGATVTFTASATDIVDGSVSTVCSPASGSVFAIGSTTVTCTATDAHANTASATFTITVQDTTPPTVTVPANILASATSPNGAVVTFTASATDPTDESVATVCSPASGSTFPRGATLVTCTATDAAHNVGSATFTITVQDTTPPTVTVPANILASATSPNGAVVTFTASATDPTDESVATVCSPASGSTFPRGATLVTCTATDAAGNVGSATFTITVQDTTPPTVTVPANILASATSPNGAVVTFTASATDPTDESVATVCSPASGSTFPRGATLVTCTATDAAHNVGSATFTITVQDTTPPTVTVPANILASATSPNGAVVTFTASATDPTDESVATVCSPASGSTFPLGATLVTCTATDAAHNVGSATFTITVSDTTAPTIDPHVNVSAQATSASGAVVTYTSPASHDAVDGNGSAICTPLSGATFPIGNTTVTCTKTDAHGNTASPTSFTITVADTTAPTIDAHANVSAPATSASGAVVTYTSPASHDAVDGNGSAVCTPLSGATFPIGNTTVTCTKTDAHGNVATPATFIVTVTPNTTPPVFANVPASLTVDATSPNGAPAAYTKPTATDYANVAVTPVCTPAPGAMLPIGTTTITCTATDSGGHSAQVNFTITVRTATQMTNNLSTMVANIASLTGMDSLNSHVQSALASLASGKGKTASNQLGALINATQAQSGKKLTVAQAAAIIAAAQQIQAVIGS